MPALRVGARLAPAATREGPFKFTEFRVRLALSEAEAAAGGAAAGAERQRRGHGRFKYWPRPRSDGAQQPELPVTIRMRYLRVTGTPSHCWVRRSRSRILLSIGIRVTGRGHWPPGGRSPSNRDCRGGRRRPGWVSPCRPEGEFQDWSLNDLREAPVADHSCAPATAGRRRPAGRGLYGPRKLFFCNACP